jgi:hypothetical protein
MYYYAPTAGYDNKPSTWVDSVGAPVQLQIPFAARAMNQACLTTGGPPPLTGALQKGGRRRANRRGGALEIGQPNTPNSSIAGNNNLGSMNTFIPNNLGSMNSPIVPNNVLANNTSSNLGIKDLNIEEVENVAVPVNIPQKSFLNRTKNTITGALGSLKNMWASTTGGSRRSRKSRKTRKGRRTNRR